MKKSGIKASIDWNIKGTSVGVEDAETRAWAEFIIDNLTTKNKEILSGVLPFTVKHNGWLDSVTAGLFGSVIRDRVNALQKAIVANQVNSYTIPTLNRQHDRYAVGAVICELIHAGYENEFLQSLETP